MLVTFLWYKPEVNMPNNLFAKKGLQPYERHAACVLIALLFGLGVAGMRNKEISHESSVPVIQVKVVGAVETAELVLPLDQLWRTQFIEFSYLPMRIFQR